jgi:hypothetical protein
MTRPDSTPPRGTLADLHDWAINLPLDEWSEHLYIVIEHLVLDLLDDFCERFGL